MVTNQFQEAIDCPKALAGDNIQVIRINRQDFLYSKYLNNFV